MSEKFFGFKVTRICNADRASTLGGVKQTELVADLKLGKRKCPIEGKSVLVKFPRAGDNLVIEAVGEEVQGLCEDPCPLCASTSPDSGLQIEPVFDTYPFRLAEHRGEKIFDFTEK